MPSISSIVSEGLVAPLTSVASNGELPHNESHTDNSANGVGMNGNHSTMERKAQLSLRDQPGYSADRKLRVITIGAGFSGLILAHKLRYEYPEMQNYVENIIFEAREDIGGTWLVNNYPGCQCDVPSHIYAFPFDPNPDWSRFYSTGPEIQEYIKRTVKKWNLDRDIQLNTRVISAVWQEPVAKWKITVISNGVTRDENADVVISGQGFLNTWKWPAIPGLLEEFKGHKVHSAAWDHTFDYSNKRIAVIGNGSSGIQILPQMAKLENTTVTSFQRNPSWIVARLDPGKLLGKPGAGDNPVYSEDEKKTFREEPMKHREYRRTLVRSINKAFKMFLKGSPENEEIRSFAAQQMADRLQHNPELCAKLIPKWELGCRRITPGANYLEAFLRPNVGLTQSPIVSVTADAIRTEDGHAYPVDVIVCATGFDVSHCPQYPVIGRNNVSLAEKWAIEPESYLSLACPDMPNYFIFTGPNAVVGHGSLVEGLSWTADYMVSFLKKIVTEEIKSVAPKQQVVDEFVRYGDLVHKTLVWTGSCSSWYKNNCVDGRVTATFPGSALLYKEMIASVRGEDFEIEYWDNRFRSVMGNGFTEYELDDKNDLAWYIAR